MKLKLVNLEKQVDELKYENNQIEQKLLGNNITITGIPITKDENQANIIQKVSSILNAKKMFITTHRLQKYWTPSCSPKPNLPTTQSIPNRQDRR